MKPKSRTAALNARDDLVSSKGKSAHLRSNIAFSAPGVEVDAEAGIIRGAAVMKIGPAMGHGFDIDAETLKQVESLGNATPGGVKVRFEHPTIGPDGQPSDDLGTVVGFVDNLRIDGDALRGDIHIGEYAKLLPGKGNVRDYLLARAKENPEGFGLSCVIGFDAEVVNDAEGNPMSLVARVFALDAIDLVGRGAATPNGLLSEGNNTKPTDKPVGNVPAEPTTKKPQPAAPSGAASQLKGKSNMDPKMKQYLSANHGLAANATDEEAQNLLDSLSEADRATMTAKLSATDPAAPEDKTAAQMSARRKAATDSGDEFLALEGKRVAQLQQLGNTLGVDKSVVQLAIAEGEDIIKARTRYLKALQDAAKPVAGAVNVGEDRKIAALKEALPDAICLRGGTRNFYAADEQGRVSRDDNGNAIRTKAHEMAQRYVGLSVLDMYRQWLIAFGAPADQVHMLSRTKLAELLGYRALSRQFPQVAMLAQSTGDFSNVVLDAQNKSMRMGYVEAARTWNLWASRGTAPDFKNINRIQTSEVPTLTQRKEGGPIDYTTLSDSKETYTLSEYIGGVRLTRRLLINDDLGALTNIPMKQGQAAARLEDDVAYAVLLANANLADTGALFNSTAVTTTGGHNNLISSGGGAPSVTTVAATEKLIMLQKGPKNAAILNLEPKILVCPIAIKTASQQFMASNVDPSKSNATPNPYNGKIQVVPNARLDNGVTVNGTTYSGSSTAWFLLADYRDGQIDTVEVSFLADEPEPVLKQETDFDTDDIRFAVRHVVAAKALDFRGMAKNPGA